MSQVVTPSPGGPADKAGIKSRDVVVSIDGKPTTGLSLYDAGDMLQGGEGSQVCSSPVTHQPLPVKHTMDVSVGKAVYTCIIYV